VAGTTTSLYAFTAGGAPLAQQVAGVTSFGLRDPHGDVVGLVSTSAGNTGTSAFDPWGKVLGTSGTQGLHSDGQLICYASVSGCPDYSGPSYRATSKAGMFLFAGDVPIVTASASFCVVACVSVGTSGDSVGMVNYGPGRGVARRGLGGSLTLTMSEDPPSANNVSVLGCYYVCAGGYHNIDRDGGGTTVGVGTPGFFAGPSFEPVWPWEV
jgi:hypothetical protein